MLPVGPATIARKPQTRVKASASTLPSSWLSIEPQTRSNGANWKLQKRSGPDALGLASTVDPLTFLVKKPQEQKRRWSKERGDGSANQHNPRHRKLQEARKSDFVAREAISSEKPMRFAKLPLLMTPRQGVQSNQATAAATELSVDTRTTEMPLHELIDTVDDAVDADPAAELNQSTIARLFMDQWLENFEADRRSYKSVAVRYEVGFEELQRRTANLPRPNELITTFCYKILEDLTPHFGPYAPLFRVLRAELLLSIYARDGVPYFAHVKHHKRLLLRLQKDKEWREERNDVLADDIDNVYSTFRRFLSECTFALSRMLLHEWHSVAVVEKKNSRKYVTYFSNWFGNTPKSFVRKLFVAWKHKTTAHRIEKVQKQMQVDLQGLTVVKRHAEDLTRQLDVAQADNLAMRTERKQAEVWAQQLELRIKAASTFLDTTRRREAIVCQECQLRVEAVSCLPPLILESILRGYHGVGFLQQTPVEEVETSSVIDEACDSFVQKSNADNTSSLLQKCLAEIARLRSMEQRRKSSVVSPIRSMRANSVAVVGVASEQNNMQPPSAAIEAVADGGAGRRAATGAVSQDELSGRTFSKFFQSLREGIQAPDAKVLFTETRNTVVSPDQGNLHENARLAHKYEWLLRAIRTQDEHYANHPKLYSSRMLENHEVSVVPNKFLSNQSLQTSDEFIGADKGELGVINGAKRYWVSNATAKKSTAPSSAGQAMRTRTRRQSVFSLKNQPPLYTPLLENLELFQETDFDVSPLHSRGFTILLLAHLATGFGSLLFAPGDMSAFTHNAYLHPVSNTAQTSDDPQDQAPEDTNMVPADDGDSHPANMVPADKEESHPAISPDIGQSKALDETSAAEQIPVPRSDLGTTVSNSSLGAIEPVVAAYNTWNQISEQLIVAGVVQSRGLVSTAPNDASCDPEEGDPSKKLATLSGTPIRPMLQHQFEPLSHSSLVAPSRDNRPGLNTNEGNTYHTTRTRHLTAEEPARLIQSVEAIHDAVKTTSVNLKAFHTTHRQLRELQITQWEQASELAAQFGNVSIEPPPMIARATLVDPREHIYECISNTNNIMRRMFSVEECPEVELTHVRNVFEKHQRLIRQLYTPYRANTKHAMTLDGLWHIVKILRLPRDIHVLPTLRDEELVANGYEQLFSPEDLGELFLQLCNEQFQPQIPTLGKRVEYFVTQHLPIALQNQSRLRVLMHNADVKLAIGSHSQTIRIIFRRYCAKERELMAPAKLRPRHTGHGISKYMRIVDWQALIQDYRLVRARFSMEQAMSVFRNVQEAAPGSDDQLEMIYSEFCEALVGVATFYVPDPFMKTATKVTQFLRRYLPLSPDDVHDHA